MELKIVPLFQRKCCDCSTLHERALYTLQRIWSVWVSTSVKRSFDIRFPSIFDISPSRLCSYIALRWYYVLRRSKHDCERFYYHCSEINREPILEANSHIVHKNSRINIWFPLLQAIKVTNRGSAR